MPNLLSDQGEDNVLTLRPRDRPALETSFAAGLGRLDPAITVAAQWAGRTAVIVGDARHPSVIAVLRGAGFNPVVTTPDRAAATIDALSPVSFLVLGPDVFATDDSVAAVQEWRSYSPSTRVKLIYPYAMRDVEVLVRAIRAGVTDVIDPDDGDAFASAIRNGLTQAGAKRERVLAIGAHPDDVEIGCAGTLLDHRRRGDRVTVLTLSRGAVGGDQEQRVGESMATAEALGAQLLFADLPDTRIDDGIATIRLIESVVAAIDPTVVYVHSSHDNHQDHRAVNTATRSATRGVRRVFAYQSPSATNEFLPTQFVNVDDTVHRKVEVLQLFRSQDGRSYLEPELVVAGARYWARHLAANARYAEPFEVVRSVGELRQAIQHPAPDIGVPDVPAEPALRTVGVDHASLASVTR